MARRLTSSVQARVSSKVSVFPAALT